MTDLPEHDRQTLEYLRWAGVTGDLLKRVQRIAERANKPSAQDVLTETVRRRDEAAETAESCHELVEGRFAEEQFQRYAHATTVITEILEGDDHDESS